MRESYIEQYLVDQVKAKGGIVRKLKWIGQHGAPDRIVMFKPALGQDLRPPMFIELKAPGEKVKPHQQREHDRLRAHGQQVFVIDSIEGVDACLS